MSWTAILNGETAPGARIIKSLLFKMRDNPLSIGNAGDLSVPTDERCRVPQCLRTASTNRLLALKKNLLAAPSFGATPKWYVSVFQTAGAWSLAAGASARDYFIEMWGAGGAGTKGGTQRGGSSGSYICGIIPACTVTIGGAVGAGGTLSGAAGGDTTLTTGPATATAWGGSAGGVGSGFPTYGGTFVLKQGFYGNAADAYTSGCIDVASAGAPAPLIGGASSAVLNLTSNAYRSNPVVGCGGAGVFNTTSTHQYGGAGMVIVWWYE